MAFTSLGVVLISTLTFVLGTFPEFQSEEDSGKINVLKTSFPTKKNLIINVFLLRAGFPPEFPQAVLVRRFKQKIVKRHTIASFFSFLVAGHERDRQHRRRVLPRRIRGEGSFFGWKYFFHTFKAAKLKKKIL